MPPKILSDELTIMLLHGLSAAGAFVTTLVLTSGIRINKGAKANFSWLFLAVAMALFGFALTSLFFNDLHLADFTGWNAPLFFSAVLLALIGALLWRRLLRQMTK